MNPLRLALVAAGALASAAIGLSATIAKGPGFVDGLVVQAMAQRDKAGGTGVVLAFETSEGWLTRHPTLENPKGLDAASRARVTAAVSAVPGIGIARWAGTGSASATLHCQEDVEAILGARSVRFSEASAAIDPASEKLLDEVAAALRPCLGGIIAITGHTDAAGDEAANVALSQARADAVRWSLVARRIPADGLRAVGQGSRQPLNGLAPADPANRRIEFSVIETMPLKPTPVDTPGPG